MKRLFDAHEQPVTETELTSSSVINMLGSGDWVMPKLAANCLTIACDTSLPATAENLFSTVFDELLLLAAITGDNDAHSEYIFTKSHTQCFFHNFNDSTS